MKVERNRNEFIRGVLSLHGQSVAYQGYSETKDYPERVAVFKRIEKTINKELSAYIKSEGEPEPAAENVKQPMTDVSM